MDAREEWEERALCRGVDPFMWLPEDENGHVSRAGQAQAKRLCLGCRVRLECLQLAMGREGDVSHHGRYGVWGGMTPRERADLASLLRGADSKEVQAA